MQTVTYSSHNRKLIIAAAAFLAASFSSPTSAAPGDTSATGTSQASIVKPLQVRNISPLKFGSIETDGLQAGKVIIRPDNAQRRFVGGAHASECLDGTNCEIRRARFAITGQEGRRYRITLPEIVPATSLASQGTDLRVTDLTVSTKNGITTNNMSRLDYNGKDTAYIGGTLRVGTDAEPGSYTAQIDVIVTYS